MREVESRYLSRSIPNILAKDHHLLASNDVMNAVFVESIGIGESMYYGSVLVKTNSNICFGRHYPYCFVVFQMAMLVNHSTSSVATCHWLIQRTLRATTTLPLIRQTKRKILHLSEIFNSEDISFEQVLQQKQMAQQLVSL